jgi:hypothetical protein
LTKYQLNAVKMLHQQLRRDAALQALANRKCLNRRNQVSSGVNISELKSDSDLARQNHQAALRWRSSNSLSSHSQGSSEQDTISSDGASYEAAGDGSYLKRVGGQEKGLNNAKMRGNGRGGDEDAARLVGGWTRPVTIPCIGYIKPEKIAFDSTCRPRGDDPSMTLERGTYLSAEPLSTPAWPSVLTRVFKVQDARELIANVTAGTVAPELWDAHFANEEMLRYEAPLVKESFESFWDSVRGLTPNHLTTFLKRFDNYVNIYDALRDLHGYKYLSAQRDLIEQQSTDVARRYAEISTLMDDPIIDAELASQFFALEGQAYHYIAKLEEQTELNELAFYMNILSEDIVADPVTAAMRQIKWAAKLVKTKRRVGEQLEGIYEWLRNFTNFMDDLRKLGEPLTAHWGKFGNDAPNSSPYSTGICAVIEAVQHYMGQVPAPIKSKFLVYLRGAGVKKARHAQDFRFELFKRAMEYEASLKTIMSLIQEPDLWRFASGDCGGGEADLRLESLTNYGRSFFSMPFGSAEAIEGRGLEQELRARSEVFQEKAESKLPP